MGDTVGVVGIDSWVPIELKHLGLLFDKLAVVYRQVTWKSGDQKQSFFRDATAKEIVVTRHQEAKWLHKMGIVLEVTDDTFQGIESTTEVDSIRREWLEEVNSSDLPTVGGITTNGKMFEVFDRLNRRTLPLDLRLAALAFRQKAGYDAHPVMPGMTLDDLDAVATKTDIIEITLAALPCPSELVSWDEIIEFRNDPSAMYSLRALRVWTTEMARGKYTVRDAQERLEFLILEYRRHLDLHRIEARTGVFGVAVNVAADVAEHVANLKFGTAARALFSLRQRRLGLLKAEASAPGREVAFLFKASRRFST